MTDYGTPEHYGDNLHEVTQMGDEQLKYVWTGPKTYEIHDSGSKARYEDGMQRDNTAGKPRFDLIFPREVPYEQQLLTRVAMQYAVGVEKYSQPKLVTPSELVGWCTCGHQTATLTGLTTLEVCAETATSAISGHVTRSLSNGSGRTARSGLPGTGIESAQSIWLTAQEAVTGSRYETGTVAGPVSDWLLRTEKDFLLTKMVPARSAWTSLGQALTWITTTLQDSQEAFYAHDVTRAWASSEIRKTLFGEHSTTCHTHRLQVTSAGISTGTGRNWEKSSSEESLAHHEAALMRHVVKYLTGTEDGEDHAAAIVWNTNAIDLTRRNIKRTEPAEPVFAKKFTMPSHICDFSQYDSPTEEYEDEEYDAQNGYDERCYDWD